MQVDHPPIVTGALTFHQAGPPKGIEHRLEVRSEEPARLLVFASPGDLAAFVEQVGTPAPRHEIPPPAQPDLDTLLRVVAARHGIEITAPPPQ